MTESKKEFYVISSKGEHSELTPIGTCGADNPCEYWEKNTDGILRDTLGMCNSLDFTEDCCMAINDGNTIILHETFGCKYWEAKEQ